MSRIQGHFCGYNVKCKGQLFLLPVSSDYWLLCLIFYIGLPYPLKTPRTKLSMKNDPITISGMKNTQLKALPRASFVCKRVSSISIMLSQDVDFWLTQYIIGVHPSMVTHWKVVSMARPMLSKDVIPEIFRVLSPLLEPGGRKRIFTFIRPVPFLQTYWLIVPDIMICNNYYLISWSKFLSRLARPS